MQYSESDSRNATQERATHIIHASWIGIVANLVLSLVKIVVGFLSGSFAVVSDGIDSGNDIMTSLITLLTAHITMRPPDIRFPFGYSRADTVATKLLSFVIFFAGAQLVISAVRHLIEGADQTLPSAAAFYVTGASILAKIGLAVYKIRTGKKHDSPMLVADGRNMQNDVFISVAVLAGLAGTHLLAMPQLDAITALLVSVWIIKVAFQIFMESNTELMDGMPDTDIYRRIFAAVARVPGAYKPHRVRVRKLGHIYVIMLDIEVEDTLNIREGHEIARRTERMIKQEIPNTYDIVVHIEPYGNTETNESFGVSERHFDPGVPGQTP